MNPPTEQLVRDYLNRVSVAARGRLSAEDRRAFLARMREFIEANTRALGHTDSADVLSLLSDLGDPAGLVDRECDHLAGQRAGSGAGGVGSPAGSAGSAGSVGAGAPPGDPASSTRPSARARRWRPAKASLADLMAARAAAVPPGQVVPVPEPAPDAPLTGELQFQTRPISSRWRPGAPMMPKPPRQRRARIPRRLQSDDAPLDDAPLDDAPLDDVPLDDVPLDDVPAGGAPPGSPPSDGVLPDGESSGGGSSGGGPPAEAEERRPAAAPPDAPADQQSVESPHGAASRQPRLRRPEWPLVPPRRPDASVGVGANGQQPPGGPDAHMSGQTHSNGAQSGGEQLNGATDSAPADGAAPDAIGPSATEPGGAEPGGAEPGGAGPGGAGPGAPEPGGGQPGGTRPAWPQAGVIPAQRIPADDAQPSEAPPSPPPASGQSAGPPQPASADTGTAGAGSADVPETAGVSSSDLVAGRAPGSRRLAAVARGSGWASGVRARGARLAGTRRPGRGTGAGGTGAGGTGAGGTGADGTGTGGAGSAGGYEPDRRPDSLDSQPGRPAEDPLSGLWPDLGPIGARAAKLARTVLARARQRPLEATAIVLLGLGGLIYPPVWLIGAAVALASRVWDFRDKWIGLAVPVFLVIIGMVADVSLGGNRSGLGGYIREAWIFGGHLSRLVAVLGAVYLAWRAERGRRSPPVAPWNKPRRFG